MEYEELIANLQYDLLLAEWRTCVNVIDAIAALLATAIDEAKMRQSEAMNAPVELAYGWMISALRDILSGNEEVIRRKRELGKSLRVAERGFSDYQLTQWRRKYAELEVENVGLKAQVEELKRRLDAKIGAEE